VYKIHLIRNFILIYCPRDAANWAICALRSCRFLPSKKYGNRQGNEAAGNRRHLYIL